MYETHNKGSLATISAAQTSARQPHYAGMGGAFGARDSDRSAFR